MTGTDRVREYLNKDTDKLAEIVEEHPFQIPVKVLAEWWHCSEDSVRNAILQHGYLGIAQKRPGKVNAASSFRRGISSAGGRASSEYEEA